MNQTLAKLRRFKRGALLTITTITVSLGFAASSYASAGVVSNWTLREDTAYTYSNYEVTDFNVGFFQFAWMSNNPHSTRIAANSCSNYNILYGSADFAAHSGAQHTVADWPFDTRFCFALRGRSLSGTQTGLYASFRY